MRCMNGKWNALARDIFNKRRFSLIFKDSEIIQHGMVCLIKAYNLAILANLAKSCLSTFLPCQQFLGPLMQLPWIGPPKIECRISYFDFQLPIGPWMSESLDMCASIHPHGYASPLWTYQCDPFFVAVVVPKFESSFLATHAHFWLSLLALWSFQGV